MEVYDWEARLAQEETRWLASERSPLEYPWGYRGGSSFVLAAGPRVFQWFKSPHEMLTWIAKVEPLIWELGPEDTQKVSTACGDALQRLEAASGQIDEEIFQMAVDSLRSVMDVEWWGHFRDLCEGDSGLPVEIRREFRGEEGEEDEELENVVADLGAAPLSAEEQEEFAEFIREWGF